VPPSHMSFHTCTCFVLVHVSVWYWCLVSVLYWCMSVFCTGALSEPIAVYPASRDWCALEGAGERSWRSRAWSRWMHASTWSSGKVRCSHLGKTPTTLLFKAAYTRMSSTISSLRSTGSEAACSCNCCCCC